MTLLPTQRERQVRSATPRVAVAFLLAATALLNVSAISAATPADAATSVASNFDQVFSATGEPSAVHYKAHYQLRGAEHELEVWRDGKTRVRRRTGVTSDAYITRVGTQEDWQMILLDHQRHAAAHLDRQSLMKLGNFTDWFDWSHGLIRPFGPHHVSAGKRPDALVGSAIEACDWYDLKVKETTSHICWSPRVRLPLLIAPERATHPAWKIVSLDTRPIAASVFVVNDKGYQKTDAARDILDD